MIVFSGHFSSKSRPLIALESSDYYQNDERRSH
jgi:hypothetical protein